MSLSLPRAPNGLETSPEGVAARGGGMASVVEAGRARLFRNPWWWLGAALALEGLALAIGTGPLTVSLVWLGLLLGAGALIIRFESKDAAAHLPAAPARLVLGIIFALLALFLTVVLVMSWWHSGRVEVRPSGLRPGVATILWFLAAPVSALAAWQCLQRLPTKKPLAALEEAAGLFLVLVIVLQLASIALRRENWLSICLFLDVASWVAAVAGPISAVDQRTRRYVTAGAILFHFGGIMTAAMSVPPNPWVFQQLWLRIYRPYLAFMYLNNAYHFYSPEPGPARYLWFRLYYEDEAGQQQAEWYKIPHVDEAGNPRHGLALIYQRSISLTENLAPSQTISADDPGFKRSLARRLSFTPQEARKETRVGQVRISEDETVPMHPVGHLQQIRVPTIDSRRLLASYVRHVAHRTAEFRPGWRLLKMRVYYVEHAIVPMEFYFSDFAAYPSSYAGGWRPDDPTYYRPFYFGEFDAEARLKEDDPYLYWMLPILRDDGNNLRAPIRDWARRHAGDPAWVGRVDATGRVQWGEK